MLKNSWRWMVAAALLPLAVVLSGSGVRAAEELKPGDKAPDFKLVGSDGKTYRLADYRGKQAVVLAWFPKAFTPGCQAECTSFAKDGSSLKAFDVAYFTASLDSQEKNAAFAKAVGADYPILSDPEGNVAKAYGVVDATRPLARRWTFVIGPDGKILDINKQVNTATHATDVAEKLKKLGVAKQKK